MTRKTTSAAVIADAEQTLAAGRLILAEANNLLRRLREKTWIATPAEVRRFYSLTKRITDPSKPLSAYFTREERGFIRRLTAAAVRQYERQTDTGTFTELAA